MTRSKGCLENLRSYIQTVFKGDTTPHEANHWITHMEKILDTMDVTGAKHVTLVTLQLEGQTAFWWQTVKRRRGTNEPLMEWEEF